MTEKTRGSRTDIDPNLYILASAALFGGDFSIDWLQTLSGMKASDILKALEKGIKAGLVLQKGAGVYALARSDRLPDIEDTLSVEETENLRRCIVDLMRTEILDERDMVKAVAVQLVHLPNNEDGCRWLIRAGDLHRKSGQPVRALQCYEKVFNDLGKKSNQESDALFIEAAVGYSKITASAHDAEPVLLILKEALRRAMARKDRARQSLLEMHLAKTEWVRNRFDQALKHYDRGSSLAKEINDPRLQRSVSVFRTFFPYWYGRFAEAVYNYEEAVPEIDRYPEKGFPLLVGSTIGVCYALTGQLSQGLGMLNALYNHCRQIGDGYIATMAKQGLGWVFLEIGRAREGLRHLEEAYRQRGEFPGVLHEISLLQTLAYAYFLNGRIKKSTGCLKAVIELRKQKAADIAIGPDLMEIFRAMDEGRYPKVTDLNPEEEITRALTSRNVWIKGAANRYLAVIQARKGLPAKKVIQTLHESKKWLMESGHQLELARARLELGRQFLREGKEQEARDEVREAAKTLLPINEGLIPDDLRFLVKDFRTGENLLDVILNVAQEVVKIRDEKVVAKRIISTVNRITGAERGAIFLPDGGLEPQSLVLRAAKNFVAGDIDDPRFARSKELILETAVTGRGRILEIPGSKEPHVSGKTIRSIICAPMKLGDKVIGVLYQDNCFLPSVFVESDLKILDYFAAQAAIALDNAKAYEKIQKMNRILVEEKQYIEEQHLENLHCEDTIGRSPAFLKTLKLVERVAEAESTVLILGETGVGKEIVARAVHRQSPRSQGPFIRVNCSALPEGLVTSELFGHEKGAFTGAQEQRLGRFELADGGTLFLDEIGDISLDVQVKLLRVLQSKEFERVGGREILRSDFRLIAATNRDLFQAVKNNRFRQDLFYRLNVFPIWVPPLRERKDDIPLLADFFLKRYISRNGRTMCSIPDQEMDKLIKYDWPGNVRELENIIERGILLSRGRRFQTPELKVVNQEIPFPGTIVSLAENERRMILMALEKTGGRIGGKGGAADLLQIHRNTLRSRMKKLNIRKEKISWSS